MPQVSFNVVRNRDGEVSKWYPFWIGTAIGMVFVMAAFLLAVVEISRAKRYHAAALDGLNAPMEQLVRENGNTVRAGFDLAEGVLMSGKTDIRLSVTSENGKAILVRLLVDGADAAVFSEGPYIYTWDTTILKNGEHVLAAIAVDESGYASMTQRKVMVENK